MSSTEFDRLVALLKDGNESLFEQVYLAQFDYCQRKLINFDGLTERQAYDATMNAMLHFRQLLLTDKVAYGNLRYLFVRIARQRLVRQEGKQAKVRPLMAMDDKIPTLEGSFHTEEQLQLMERAFRQLGGACRQLLKQVYFQHKSLKSIAEEEDQSYVNLRKQKSRCVRQLRQRCEIANSNR